MRIAPLLFAAVAPTAGLLAQFPVVQTVLSNGTTQSRYDMVILAEGYQATEQAQFDQDVAAFLTALFQKQPYSTFAAYYNVHTVFRPSVDSGADRPDETPPIFVNTVYDATYDYGGVDRCLYVQNTSQALADAALAPANEGLVLVLVNDDRYGGCAGTFAVSYNGAQMTEVQAHELGHSLGALADEYDYPYVNYTGGDPAAVNITTSPTGQKWAIWHGTEGIAAFQGAGYHQFGLYRPRFDCLMRSLGQALCRVCQENISLITNAIVDVISSTTPASASVQLLVPALQQFSFTHFVPAANSPTIEWSLDGAVVPGATTASFTLDTTTVALGPHTLTATVVDNSDRVRSDPGGAMRESHSWQVHVSDPTAAQLRVPSFTLSAILPQPGSPLTLTPTIANDGPAAAGPFAVEFFLTTGTTWTPQDTYLGRIDVPGLAANQTLPLQLATQLPWSIPTQLHRVHAVVDRADTVFESNEADNTRVAVFICVAGPCATGLEFRDPLTTPAAATISLSTGGVLHPTVVAPCADPTTTFYLIAWTGSGTSPGLPLAPGLVLPLNPDGLTQLGLTGLNGPIFGQFLGLLDPSGVGQATFTLPPTTALAVGTTHFAPLLLGTSQLFVSVGAAVAVTLTP